MLSWNETSYLFRKITQDPNINFWPLIWHDLSPLISFIKASYNPLGHEPKSKHVQTYSNIWAYLIWACTYEGVYIMYLRGGKLEKTHFGMNSKLQCPILFMRSI